MPLRAIAYTSELSPDRSIEDVDALTREAADHNQSAGITGVLLFDGSRFLQYLEGPDDALDTAYARICAATSHHSMMELGRSRIGRRHFPYWTMRLLPAEPQALRAAIRNDWTGFVVRTLREGNRLYGVEGLASLVDPHLGTAEGALSEPVSAG